LEENNNNDIMEFKNNIRVFLSKYKQHKKYELIIDIEKISSLDTKSKRLLSSVDLPICFNLSELYEKELHNLNNVYNKTKLAYEILISRDDIEENKIEEFKKLREKYNKKVNEVYILQYLLNYMNKHVPSNPNFTIHYLHHMYNINSESLNPLLSFKSSNIKLELLENIILDESELLDNYIKLKHKLLMMSDTEKSKSDKSYNEIKEDIKIYLKKKKENENFIKKLYNKKNNTQEIYLYLYPNQIKKLDIHFLNNHYRNITRNIKKNNEI
jgi:hypothetical protein